MRASTLGTQSFFQYLSRYSNLPALQAADTTKVITTTHHLEHGHLSQLFTHQVVAVHVKQYIPPSIALELAAHYSAISRRGGSSNWEVTTERGLESSDVQTIGTPSNMQTSAPDPSFHATIAATLQSYRSPVHPIHPLDKLRLDLDELHPSGCTIKKSPSGRPFNPGLPRITQGPTRWRSGFIHVDDLSPMTADQVSASERHSQRMPYPTPPPPRTNCCSLPNLTYSPPASTPSLTYSPTHPLTHSPTPTPHHRAPSPLTSTSKTPPP